MGEKEGTGWHALHVFEGFVVHMHLCVHRFFPKRTRKKAVSRVGSWQQDQGLG